MEVQPRYPAFEVDRASAKRLSDLFGEGLRKAIVSGFYKAGDVLPARDKLAVHYGVSETVVRTALRQLMAENLLVSRPKIGCMVLKASARRTFERVLIVTAEQSGAYSMSIKEMMIEKVLVREGYCPFSVCLESMADGRLDCAGLKRALEYRPDFVVLQSCLLMQKKPIRLVERSGCPYLVVGGNAHGALKSVSDLGNGAEEAVADFIGACRRSRIYSVCQIGFGANSQLDVGKPLTAIGVNVERIDVKLEDVFGDLEAIQKAASLAVARRLGQGPLPDLLFFTDDYLTLGALPVLLERGVRIPEDVRIVTLANRGFGPVFTKSFARIEVDMRKTGLALGRSLVNWFRTGEFPALPPDVRAIYVPGETFPSR